MIDYLVLVPVGYLLGSLPFGLIAGLAFRRIDVRQFGSGKTGTTNVARTVGTPVALAVMLLDMGKTILAVVLARVFADSHGVEAAAAMASLFGHNWPVFIGFKGGRGTASGWGGLLILSPWAGLASLVFGGPALALTGYVSFGSIVGASSGSVVLVVLSATGHGPVEYIWFGSVACLLVIARHRDNIQRLLKGEERKLGQRTEASGSLPKPERRKGLRWSRSA